MARPPHDPDREDTRLRLLKAAEAAFGRSGYARTRLADVAAEAGVRRPSLLHHFGSKAALYTAVVERAFADLRAELDAGARAAAEQGFVALLDTVTARLLAFVEARPAVPALALREILDGHAEHGTDLLERELVPFVDELEALVRQAGRGVVPEAFPVRDALLTVIISHLVRAGASSDAPTLWPSVEATPFLIRALLLGGASLLDVPGEPR